MYQRHVSWRPIISEKGDKIGFNPSQGMLQAEGFRRGLAGLGEHAPIQPPPEMAVKGVLRVLMAHGPLRFESIASHLEQSHSSSLVRECLQWLVAGQKVRETALSKELHNNYGKVDSIEKLYWVASSGGASSNPPPQKSNSQMEDAVQIDRSHESRQLDRERIPGREVEISPQLGAKIDAPQISGPCLNESRDSSKHDSEGDLELWKSELKITKIISGIKSTNRKYLTPPEFLAQWLDRKMDTEKSFLKDLYHEQTSYSSALPTILVEYMHQSERPQQVCTGI